jgi:excinuclease UvrABC nuclease subunit
MFLKNERNRLAFRFGRQTGLRSTSDVVDQLQAQIERLQEQLKFNAAEHERQIAVLLRDLMQAKYELARRDMIDAFASAPSPSAMKH